MWVCAYPVFYDNWPMKCENNGSLLQGKPVYRRVVLKSIWLPQFPTSCTLLNTVQSHCLLYIPNFQNISKCHGRMGFADDFVQWCGERYEIEIKHTLPCHHTDTHTHKCVHRHTSNWCVSIGYVELNFLMASHCSVPSWARGITVVEISSHWQRRLVTS